MSAGGDGSLWVSEEKRPIILESGRNKNIFRRWIDQIPTRYVFAFLGFLGMMNVYAMRVNLSIAMVAMIDNNALPRTNASEECSNFANNSIRHLSTQKNGEFAWDEHTQGIILGSFFWGYIVTQLPGGRWAEMYSGKWLFGLGVLCTAVFTLLTPVAARLGVGCLIAVRILEGLGEGVTFPAMHVMLSKWCLPLERSKLSTFVYTGAQVGTVIALPISGLLCDYGFDGGWPTVFYFFGTLGVLWFIAWSVFAYDSPFRHPRISDEERNYIMNGLGFNSGSVTIKTPKVPWRHVLTSLPVWAIVAAHFGQNWGFYTMLTEMPTYMKNILHYDIKANSAFSALPYLGMWAFGLLASYVADHVRSNGTLSTTTVRKVANLIGTVGPALALIGITLIGCNHSWNLVFLILAVSINGAVYAGFQCNHIDIAPRFAGTLLGISNSIATIPGIAAPYVVGVLTQNQQTLHQWYIVFYIAAAIYILVALLFVLLGSGEEQFWCKLVEEEDEEQLHNSVAVNSDKDE